MGDDGIKLMGEVQIYMLKKLNWEFTKNVFTN